MKKLTIILSAFMLNWSFCFGGESIKFSDTTAKLIPIGSTVKNITVKTSAPFTVQISDTTIAKTDSSRYETIAGNSINLAVHGINYGTATITAICGNDTAKRDIIIVPANYDKANFMLVISSIDSLRNQLKEKSLNNTPPLNSQTTAESIPIQNDLDSRSPKYEEYFYISIALIALALILLVLFILSWKDAKKQKEKVAISNAEIRSLKERMNELHTNISNLKDRETLLVSEKKKLEYDYQKFRTESNQNQQSQKSNDAQQTLRTRPEQSEWLPLPPQSLYADAIIDGKFNRVSKQPTNDTIFELKLSKQNEKRANVIIYEGAHELVKKRPEFLEGCEKQILGNSNVSMIHEGEAQKDDTGNWVVFVTPEVKIS